MRGGSGAVLNFGAHFGVGAQFGVSIGMWIGAPALADTMVHVGVWVEVGVRVQISSVRRRLHAGSEVTTGFSIITRVSSIISFVVILSYRGRSVPSGTVCSCMSWKYYIK